MDLQTLDPMRKIITMSNIDVTESEPFVPHNGMVKGALQVVRFKAGIRLECISDVDMIQLLEQPTALRNYIQNKLRRELIQQLYGQVRTHAQQLLIKVQHRLNSRSPGYDFYTVNPKHWNDAFYPLIYAGQDDAAALDVTELLSKL